MSSQNCNNKSTTTENRLYLTLMSTLPSYNRLEKIGEPSSNLLDLESIPSHLLCSSQKYLGTAPMANVLNTKYRHKSKPYNRLSQQFGASSGGKQCRYCKRNGHLIEECLKKRWRDTQARDEEENGAEKATSQPYWQQGKEKNAQSSASQSYW